MSRLYDLRDFCRAEHGWLTDTIEALARLESPTDDKAAVDRCGRELASRLERIGGRVTRVPTAGRGDHLLVEFPELASRIEPSPRPGGCPQILLLGHFDTVWPIGQLDRMPIVRVKGRLHGPGVYDMKAGIGIGMLALRALAETGARVARRVVMLWTSDEELGSGTSQVLIEDEARRSEAVLVLEPSLPGGGFKTSRKGCAGYEIIVRGVAAHAGIEPEKGASAVQELAHQILRINAFRSLGPDLSVNVVQVSGGTCANMIPDRARALVDVRVPSVGAWDGVVDAFAALEPVDPRTTLECRGWFDRPPMERSRANVRLYEQARRIGRELGQDLAEGGTGGGSDGNFTAALGVPTLDGVGAIGAGAHAIHEHVVLEALPDRAALVAELVASL
jgi:glutamate carboxypeptidase